MDELCIYTWGSFNGNGESWEHSGRYTPLHWNRLSGVVSRSLSAMSAGPVQRAMPRIRTNQLYFALPLQKTSVFFLSMIPLYPDDFLPGSLNPALTH